ncbi:blood vessel epicardial substance-like [Saccostrea echinata]|uniref:blood vessel epicardial substance-like n=1 Tax=Saccostrea echinata TaxID=191078 RepID=UPI002A7FC4D9|nr:blood vessel epicardial substance-like [Saccostrea echinata]
MMTLNQTLSQNDDTEPHSDDAQGACADWREAQHSLFQLANMCLILSFLTPNKFRYYPLCLRIFLGTGYLFFSLWSGLIVCMPDVLIWSAGFFFVNLLHLCYIGYSMLPSRINKDLDDLYKKLFEPLRVSKPEYDCLVKVGYVHGLERFDEYAKEGLTPCGLKTSILLKGRLKVQFEELLVHYIEGNQFVDSPEYDFTNRTLTSERSECNSPERILLSDKRDTYQVTISAVEESLLLTWSLDKLSQFLQSNPALSAIFQLLIGKDISDKLYQIQEMLLSDPECPLARSNQNYQLRTQTDSHSSQSSLLNL